MSQSGLLRISSGVLPPDVPTTIFGNTGSAVPVANTLFIIATEVAAGTVPITTNGVGNTLTIQAQIASAVAASDATRIGLAAFDSASFSVDVNGFVSFIGGGGFVQSVSGTANRITSTGGVNPVIDISAAYVGQTSITTLGTITTGTWNGSTITVPFGGTGQITLTNHGVLIGQGASAIASTAAGNAGQVLQSAGAAADPVYSTATYPSTSTINQLLYSSAANTITGLATANRAVLTTGATGIPVLTALATDGQIIIGSTAGVPAAALLTAGTGVTISNASNSITINASAATPLSFPTDSGTATPAANALTIAGSGSIATSGSGAIVTVALSGLTNHAVLIGSGTSTITKVGPVASTGAVLQSNGVGSDPGFSTATYPSISGTAGKILISDGSNIVSSTPTYPNVASTALKHIKSDGTNFVTTTVTYPDASVTAGKVIVSDGTNYIASTPTFPNASATTGKIIISDGTNWIASTPTYPAAAGTSGNVLTSDGTNWNSTAPSSGGGLLVVSGTLTNAQVKALHGTPVQIVAAQGSGTFIQVVTATGTLNYGGTNVFTAGASQSIDVYYGTAVSSGSILSNAAIVASSSRVGNATMQFTSNTAYASCANAALNLYVSSATEITGNAANNNTVSYNILYRVLTIP